VIELFKYKRFRIQKGRCPKKFNAQWVPDIVSDELMVAELTVFGISFVWLGTAY
jgi:hypothetical protein